jgi:hypothetical protein
VRPFARGAGGEGAFVEVARGAAAVVAFGASGRLLAPGAFALAFSARAAAGTDAFGASVCLVVRFAFVFAPSARVGAAVPVALAESERLLALGAFAFSVRGAPAVAFAEAACVLVPSEFPF